MRNIGVELGGVAIILAGFTFACHAQTPSPTAMASGPAQQSALPALPATFIGTLPCADCPGIRYQLNLNADHSFTSRMTYEERNTSFNEGGRWELSDDGKMLVLHNGRGQAEKFALHGDETLRMLDADGKEINSKFNYDLKRTPEFTPLAGGTVANATLENTSWKLTRLGDSSVHAPSKKREAYFLLDPANHRVSGSGGCNRLMGTYEVKGDELKFGRMASTMMACPDGMETEQAFLKSLGQVSKWKISGHSLELSDSDGKVLAHFEVREN
jgi:heat shock protein HslJ